MVIRSLAEANEVLLPYTPSASRPVGSNLNLDRMTPLMELIGNPQDDVRVIHVAGTSGKTSTAYYMAALLQAAGYKTGLTVSPHIDAVNERVQVNGEPLPEGIFCQELGAFLEIVQQTNLEPSYFELLFAFALWVFVRQQVDYVVLETGIGGLRDASNITDRADKVCIITDIGFDHMDVLGNTLAEIATQKIGIVHHRNHAFMYEQGEEIMRPIRGWMKERQATLHVVNEQAELKQHRTDLTLMIDYQRRNWLLAYRVYRYLEKRDNLQHLTRQVLQKSQAVQVPGRMDIRRRQGKTIIMDGAHNGQKMMAFVRSFRQLYPHAKPAVLLGMKEGKEYEELVPLLLPLVSRLIATAFDARQDARTQSMDPGKLAAAFHAAGMANVQVIADQREAFKALMEAPEEVCIITGSFYLLAQLRSEESLV